MALCDPEILGSFGTAVPIAEDQGLDIGEHGEEAYGEDFARFQFVESSSPFAPKKI